MMTLALLDNLFTVESLISLIVGTLLGLVLDRLYGKFESRPLFRVSLGLMEDKLGKSPMVVIQNVGLVPIQEYEICLFHPDRGQYFLFEDYDNIVFPQHPEQTNKFRTVMTYENGGGRFVDWVRRARDKTYEVPSLSGFSLQIYLKNSEYLLFESTDLGTAFVMDFYERCTQGKIESPDPRIRYVSKAPFWAEWIRARRLKKQFEEAKKVSKEDNAAE